MSVDIQESLEKNANFSTEGMDMNEPESLQFTRQCIVGIEHPDGKRTAQEMIVHRTAEGELIITPLPGTERALPLTKEEAEKWVTSLPENMPEEIKQEKIRMLCFENIE
jgi:hypothetical protein